MMMRILRCGPRDEGYLDQIRLGIGVVYEDAARAPHTLRPSSVLGCTPCSRTWSKVLKRSDVVTCSAT